MTQQEVNDSEWANPDNWSDGFAGIYFSKKDSRTWVPKRIRQMGWTLNMARKGASYWLLLFTLGIPVFAVLLLIALLAATAGGLH